MPTLSLATACSDSIGFPLSRSIASTGFQFVSPEIHLPATFLINPPPVLSSTIDHVIPPPQAWKQTTGSWLSGQGMASLFKAMP